MELFLLGLFHKLMTEMAKCQSFAYEFPEPGMTYHHSNVISPKSRVLLALRYLSSKDSYQSISKRLVMQISFKSYMAIS